MHKERKPATETHLQLILQGLAILDRDDTLTANLWNTHINQLYYILHWFYFKSFELEKRVAS